MADQPGGTVWVESGWHPKEKIGIVVLHIPGQPPYFMRPEDARKVGHDLTEASAVARFDAGVYRMFEEEGKSLDEAEALLSKIGRAGGGIDPEKQELWVKTEGEDGKD